MPKYLFTYHGGGMPESEEEQAKHMAAWGEWYGTLGESIVDGGAPTGASQSIAPDGAVSSGTASGLTGYTVIDAADLDDAVAKAKGCPILSAGGTVEVYATIDMG